MTKGNGQADQPTEVSARRMLTIYRLFLFFLAALGFLAWWNVPAPLSRIFCTIWSSTFLLLALRRRRTDVRVATKVSEEELRRDRYFKENPMVKLLAFGEPVGDCAARGITKVGVIWGTNAEGQHQIQTYLHRGDAVAEAFESPWASELATQETFEKLLQSSELVTHWEILKRPEVNA